MSGGDIVPVVQFDGEMFWRSRRQHQPNMFCDVVVGGDPCLDAKSGFWQVHHAGKEGKSPHE